MAQKESVESYTFESRAAYEKAKKEDEIISQIREKTDMSNPKTVLKIYNKLVSEKIFSTVVGYQFLLELRGMITKSGIVEEDSLAEIPVPYVMMKEEEKDTMPDRFHRAERYKRLYEGQMLLNKKLKIGLLAMGILLLGFVIINFRFQYSIFTYFTDYKSNMEEELLDKYEEWETELQEREQAIEQGKTGEPSGKEPEASDNDERSDSQ